jgi:hypothetical protein
VPSPSTHAQALGACAAILLLSACGGTTATVTPSSSTSAGSTPTVAPSPFAGTGFRTNIPPGWQDETTNPSAVAAASGAGIVLMILTAPDHGVVVARTASTPVADDQLSQYLTSVIPPGSTSVSQPEPVDINGVSGVLVTFLSGVPAAGTPSGVAQEHEDMVVNQAGNTYEIALTAPQATFSLDSTGLQAILNGWTWG